MLITANNNKFYEDRICFSEPSFFQQFGFHLGNSVFRLQSVSTLTIPHCTTAYPKLASIGELSSGIAHEINNPLGIILGYTQLLLRSEDTHSDRFNDLKTIEKHVQSCKAIVEDLLNFARTSSPEKENLDIHAVIDDVIGFVRHHSNLENIEINSTFAPMLPSVLMDEKKIKQVLINLLMNAIHAVAPEGTITLTTGLNNASSRIMVEVADTGHGIEEHNLSRIFDPFFTTKPTGEGTGLGLSVSYGIIKGHGGNITVKSDQGRGAVFTLSLPVAPRRPV